MAIQPRDRQRLKHKMVTANRSTPKLVNRTNKTLLLRLRPELKHLQPYRFCEGWWLAVS